jgi:ABC-type multidrug transport system ATPase subunit
MALDGLDLEVHPGELLAVLGPNGAGKTTAIALWLGLIEADSGTVRLMGRDPGDVTARREVGMMMQDVALDPTLRVRELIELAASYYPAPMTVAEALTLTGTAALSNRLYHKLSGGQKRLVQFALAIVGRPRLLFLDEPTVGLDIEARQTMWASIRTFIAQGGSIVLTTHYLEEAEELADRVAVLANGRLIASGTVDEVRSLVVRKRISCATALDPAEVRGWPGVVDVHLEASQLLITATDAESIVRRLLAQDQALHNLEVRQAGLAEAFTHLTKDAA